MVEYGGAQEATVGRRLLLDVAMRALFIAYATACYAYAGMVVQKTQGVFKSAVEGSRCYTLLVGVGPWHISAWSYRVT